MSKKCLLLQVTKKMLNAPLNWYSTELVLILIERYFTFLFCCYYYGQGTKAKRTSHRLNNNYCQVYRTNITTTTSPTTK